MRARRGSVLLLLSLVLASALLSEGSTLPNDRGYRPSRSVTTAVATRTATTTITQVLRILHWEMPARTTTVTKFLKTQFEPTTITRTRNLFSTLTNTVTATVPTVTTTSTMWSPTTVTLPATTSMQTLWSTVYSTRTTNEVFVTTISSSTTVTDVSTESVTLTERMTETETQTETSYSTVTSSVYPIPENVTVTIQNGSGGCWYQIKRNDALFQQGSFEGAQTVVLNLTQLFQGDSLWVSAWGTQGVGGALVIVTLYVNGVTVAQAIGGSINNGESPAIITYIV